MRMLPTASVCAVTLATMSLAGCGSNSTTSADNGDNVLVSAPATAAKPTSAAPAKPDCHSLPTLDAKTDNDIAGIEMGMSADDVIRIGQCKDGYDVSVRTDEAVTVPDGGHPRVRIDITKESDVIRVFVVGMPGQERVIGIARAQKFARGQEPVLAEMRKTLMDKYGPLIGSSSRDSMTGATDPNDQAMAFSPAGQPLPENRAGDTECAYSFGPYEAPDQIGQLKEVCGFTKKIVVIPADNPSLTASYSVRIADQNGFFKTAREMGATMKAMREGKQAQETQKAASANPPPKL